MITNALRPPGYQYGAYFTMGVKPNLGNPPLKLNGVLAKFGLNFS